MFTRGIWAYVSGAIFFAASTIGGAAMADLHIERNPELDAQLRAALAQKSTDYVPRTHLLNADGSPKYVNRLILEASPYLTQHAHNPVDWRPWGEEALAEAQRRGVPIFLSVGYATCHWCHVMEEESFDNEAVAEILNRDFVAIKVDREQRPDIDQTFMLATMFMTQRGGWPNSLWLTPEGKPFYAGTYFPEPHFREVLGAVSEAWTTKRSQVQDSAARLSEAIQNYVSQSAAAADITDETHAQAIAGLQGLYNSKEGGFGRGPQFPQEPFLLYALDQWRRFGDPLLANMITHTLDNVVAGGIHDHVGGGFHRYAVDSNWRTPHFEKMLYNQGQMGLLLVEAWEAFNRPEYARAARRTFDYVLADMSAPDGAFYAAEDADSLGLEGTEFAGERAEGAFYTWSAEQIQAVLGAEAEGVINTLGATEFATLVTGPVAHLKPGAPQDYAVLDPQLERLRAAREERPRPLRDDKIIAGWNGLMIRALAEGGAAFGEARYIAAASRAGDAVWRTLWDEQNQQLSRLYTKERVSELPATLDDYAWLGLGYLALSDATGEERWLERARQLADQAFARFAAEGGRLKMAEADGPLGPMLETDDGATPAGESSALELAALLSRRTEGLRHAEQATGLIASISGNLAARPADRVTALRAVSQLFNGEGKARQAAAAGKVMAHARLTDAGVAIDLRIAPGWHINAHQPLEEELIATVLQGDGVLNAQYPAPIERALGFQDAPLALIEGSAVITAELAASSPAGAGRKVSLTAQACSDEVCLAPEVLTFRLP